MVQGLNHEPGSVLVVQAIHTQWSKRARGAPLAVARNQVPAALPIRLDQAEPASSGYFIHYVVFSEADAFAEPYLDVTRTHAREEIWRYDRVFLRPHGLTLEMPHSSLRQVASTGGPFELVGFGLIWDDEVEVVDLRGHAPPSAGARRAFTLRPGEWGRVRCNRRLTVDVSWVYEQWTINVALTSRCPPGIFEESEPDDVYERMSELR